MRNFRLLDFYATWCEPCKWSAPIVEEVMAHFKDVIALEKIDIDQDAESVNRYNIRSVPTFVLLENEKEIWRMNGFDRASAMITAINGVINPPHEQH
jgi:thioredoxin 1